MENENLENTPELDIYAREEACEKAIRTIRKAVFMRVFVTVLLIAASVYFQLEALAVGLLVFVNIINLTGMLPLVKEWKRLRAERKMLIEMEDE